MKKAPLGKSPIGYGKEYKHICGLIVTFLKHKNNFFLETKVKIFTLHSLLKHQVRKDCCKVFLQIILKIICSQYNQITKKNPHIPPSLPEVLNEDLKHRLSTHQQHCHGIAIVVPSIWHRPIFDPFFKISNTLKINRNL